MIQVGDRVPTWFSGSPDGLSTVLAVLEGKGIRYLRLTALNTRSGWIEMTYTSDLEAQAVARNPPKLLAETYVCAKAHGMEYGYCFKQPDSDDSVFDLVLGTLPLYTPRAEGAAKSQWAKFKWAADAIVRAAP